MAQELNVASNTEVLLNDRPSPDIAGAMQRITINKLSDLVSHEIVRSNEDLAKLLDAAKKVTVSAITAVPTFQPPVFVHGTPRPDLRRFAPFTVAAAELADKPESGLFWRIVRGVEPRVMASLTVNTRLSDHTIGFTRPDLSIIGYRFADLTVNQNAVLRISVTTDFLRCNHMLIKRGGRVIVEGSGVTIKAISIKGEQ
jgi:hypothetical protein